MKELLIDNGLSVIRLARVEGGALSELYFSDRLNGSRVGNIYVALVKNVLPSGFVFLDIGALRDAFLFSGDKKERRGGRLKIGQSVLVQVLKDESLDKGALVTTKLTFTNKYFALMGGGCGDVGVSRKIAEADERARLKGVVVCCLDKDYDAVVRTEAAGCDGGVLRSSLSELKERYVSAAGKGVNALPPQLIYGGESLLVKSADKMLTKDIDRIIINRMEEGFYTYLGAVYGGVLDRLEVYDGDMPLFERYLIEDKMRAVLNKKVWLKSGGYLIIERTEACHTVDVNTGKFIRCANRGGMISKTNLEAAVEAARQIRLRNLSGLIMIDFINPENAAETNELAECLKDALKGDRVPVKVECVTDMGVFLLIRKYTGPPVERWGS
jgi:ribonuclease G